MVRTRVGYAGGTKPNPTYEDLGDHTEAIQIVYDPDTIGYGTLLEVFWASHSPLHEPWSVQYRSAIFPADADQRKVAEQSLAAHQKAEGRRLYTAIEDDAVFWTAEDYHQKYRLRSEPVLMKALVDRYPDGSWVDSTVAARLNALLGGHDIPEDLDRLGLPPDARALLDN